MKNKALLFSAKASDESCPRLANLMRFLDISPVLEELPTANTVNSACCAIISANHPNAGAIAELCSDKIPVLIYGFREHPAHTKLVSELSSGGLCGITNIVDRATYHIPERAHRLIRRFAGLQFGPANRLLDCTFIKVADTPEQEPLAFINDKPFFLRLGTRPQPIFLLGVAGVTNISQPAEKIPETSTLFSSLICFVLFMKNSVSRGGCQPSTPYGCVVIDDPLLKPRYGFIRYTTLLDDAKKLNYAVSIAHIPANWISPVKLRHTLVGGSKQMVLYNDLNPDETIKVYNKGVSFNHNRESVHEMLVSYRSGDVHIPKTERTEALAVDVRHFAECVANGTKPISDGESGLATVRILEAATKSMHMQGRPFELP